MKGFCIKNDGAASIAALELIGASNKDGETFGLRFGSGFKYAVAAAIRNGIQIRVATQDEIVRFTTKTENIGSRDVQRIVMLVGQRRIPTSWTSELGKHDWRDKPEEGVTVEWMIIRELVSNALDEGKNVEFSRENGIEERVGTTKIWVQMTNKIQQVADNLCDYFLKLGSRLPIAKSDQGSIYAKINNRPARIYHRGIFCRELQNEQLLYEYDLAGLQLSESRSVDVWNLKHNLANLLANSSHVTLARIMSEIRHNPETFEAKVDMSYYLDDTKMEIMKKAFGTAFGESSVMIPPRAEMMTSTIDTLVSSGREMVCMPAEWRKVMSGHVADHITVCGRDMIDGFEYVSQEKAQELVGSDAVNDILAAYEFASDWFHARPPLGYFKYRGSGLDILGRGNEKGVFLNIEHSRDKIRLRQTMLEEFAHHLSKCADQSRGLVDFLTLSIAKHGDFQRKLDDLTDSEISADNARIASVWYEENKDSMPF